MCEGITYLLAQWGWGSQIKITEELFFFVVKVEALCQDFSQVYSNFMMRKHLLKIDAVPLTPWLVHI